MRGGSRQSRTMRRLWIALLWVPLASGALAQEGEAPAAPAPGTVLEDEEFGVATREPGLRRQVEMAQWRRVDGGFALAWSEAPVDSGGFPVQYRNPGAFELQGRTWSAEVVLADGYPLDPAAVEALGAWRPLAPDPDALPPNLAATFQPDGEGLSTSADPAAPLAGDLRIHWFERALPPLQGRVALRDGVWTLADGVAADAPGPAVAEGEGAVRSRKPWIVGFLLLIAAILVARHHRRRRPGKDAPPA